ncbi:MAG: YdeI family protein [Marinobacter sp.]|uniref:YdeI/OmpD-associated family protein n=1 Tax=Marinobacter sp. TaxID=50741 RepID=UPI00299D3237|nr:YdeI family protein [Marinobacter sp.]MDX1757163.1 YdeI family protein [Marinobacter sp.]
MTDRSGGKTSPQVDAFLGRSGQWQKEYEALRAIMLDLPLDEGFKWGKPCYAVEGRNVVLIHGFKAYCALLFMKGALLRDPDGILVQQTANTQAARQIRFTSVPQIKALEPVLKAYINQAIEVEKAGLTVDFKDTEDFTVPQEFQDRLDADPAVKAAFESLTPGRQRGYLLHFSGAKQSRTRASRVEQCVARILAGKGLSDR